MGVTDERFFNPDLISLLPMDFYYRDGAMAITRRVRISASKWHPQLELMPDIQLILLVGGILSEALPGWCARPKGAEEPD